MAVYIPIRKEQEDSFSVTYAYGVEQAAPIVPVANASKPRFEVFYEWGSFRFDKSSGEAELVRIANGDDRQQKFLRAVVKVTQHWKEGSFPEETCFAA